TIAICVHPGEIRLIFEGDVFEQTRNSIEAEPGNTFSHPETRHVEHRISNILSVPVQVWLFLIERVIVVLIARRDVLPSRVPEDRLPIIGRLTVGLSIVPDVPISFRILSRRFRLSEPGMPV